MHEVCVTPNCIRSPQQSLSPTDLYAGYRMNMEGTG
jgi:hypothetical protein